MALVLETNIFLKKVRDGLMIDVRSPAEYSHGHIPGAYNIPLFSDEIRKKVGTIYNKKGEREALLLGLDLVGPGMSGFIRQLEGLSPGKVVFLYCWRGGNRSRAMAWLFELFGYSCFILKGGYKSFRNLILSRMEEPYRMILLGGKTGSGKSHILRRLSELGEQIVDLEMIANHKGSAFGDLGQPDQTTPEQFENDLGMKWLRVKRNRMVWLEDESLSIGRVNIPASLYSQMNESPLVIVELESDLRIAHILDEYGNFPAELLVEAVRKITKKLGAENARDVERHILGNNLRKAVEILLQYYDKAYMKSIGKRSGRVLETICFRKTDWMICAKTILRTIKQNQI